MEGTEEIELIKHGAGVPELVSARQGNWDRSTDRDRSIETGLGTGREEIGNYWG